MLNLHEHPARPGAAGHEPVSAGRFDRGTVRVLRTLFAVSVLACAGVPAGAAEDAVESVELTPTGAERGGSKDGVIPAWEGGLQQPPKGWTPDRGYVDPFPTDKPLLVIDAKNVDAHKEKLSPGLLALVKGGDVRLPVYQTRRTAAMPAWVADAAKREAANIKISGDTILGRNQSTIPFLEPKSGAEVMWNHRLRYRGGVDEHEEFWYPVRDGKIQAKVGFRQRVAENFALDTPTPNGIIFLRGRFFAPPVLAHNETIVHETLEASEDSRNWWVLNDAQKRARRLNAAGYDDMPTAVDELRTRDQSDGFNGSLNRYEWKLAGKKEMLVPYNIFKLADKRLAIEHVLGSRSVKPDFMRYELHRVWVVEATLKAGMRHLYPKRTFYVDEDSWSVLLEDVYDSRGSLWRVGVHGLTQFYDVQVPAYRVNIWHDLANGAYLVGGLDLESKMPRKFATKASLADFMPTPVVTNKKEGSK